MITLASIDTIIARREYTNLDGGHVQVLLGKPVPFPKGGGLDDFFYGPFQILGVEDERVMFSVGTDEVDALINAIRMVGATLCSTKPAINKKLRWTPGETDDDLGFPADLISSKNFK